MQTIKMTVTEHHKIDSSGGDRLTSRDITTEEFDIVDEEGNIYAIDDDGYDDECGNEMGDQFPIQLTIWGLAIVFAGTLVANAISALLTSL